ncbi:MAG: gas vesicle protein K [Chloroflexi bacterium]|nr:MAG: gas vesicle protein K [Chloroflexota bacterium]
MTEQEELAELRREVERLRGILPEHVDVDPDGVEFLRQLLERQAVRRMEGGTLSDDEIERMGLALMRLEEKVHQIARSFGLDPSELNLGLGPLGKLL